MNRQKNMALNKKFQHLKIELKAIIKATNNFSEKNCIGNGGFGNVYKGELTHSEGRTTVAIKVLDPKFGQGNREFWKEVMLLSHYKHPNVASLLGFCDEGIQKILVYEFAFWSSLDGHLGKNFTWVQRLNICIGAARGLAYLHNPDGGQKRVLHRDIKSSNILLNENFKAMIADFGLSKIGPANQQDTYLVTEAVGTSGYCDPNYIATGLLTKESDVYSFGVVLFEVICGRLCASNNNTCSLIKLARDHYDQKKMKDIIHQSIKDEINPESLNVFTTIAYQCLNDNYEERPLMTEVVRDLENALRFQENGNVIIRGELLSVKPPKIHFPFESMKEISTSMQLRNRTYSNVAFKVKSTRRNTYAALPPTGILLPQSTCQIKLTMQPEKENPDHDTQRNDKYLVQSAVVKPGVTLEEITPVMFNKESGNQVWECTIDVIFVDPKLPQIRIIEEDVLPTTSISDAGTVNLSSSNTFNKESGNQVEERKLHVKNVDPHQPSSSATEDEKKVLSKRTIFSHSRNDEVSGKNSFNDLQENSKGAHMRGLLSIEPNELLFPFELMKEISISLQLKNKTGSHVAFKVKTTEPNKYAADPTTGILLPNSTRNVSFTMQAQKEAPLDMECNDKYMLQSAVVNPEFLLKDITRELFNKESGNQVETCILNVRYVAPHQAPSSVSEARKKVFSKSGNIRPIRYDMDDFHSF
uniref:probable serine/threonine-protein kinase PknB n=1 Tax=Erigeron canadensis TaxID=72917 RepID=UPI001CB8AF5A|nr:probable serine/threonine-protein kinase PknB [Erigeron canadensis]